MKTKIFTLIALAFSMVVSSCDMSDITLYSPTNLTLYSGETSDIDAESTSSISYESGNEYYATVSRYGTITAERVGYTFIYLNDDWGTKTISVTIKPYYNLYDTPLCDQYLSRSDIEFEYGIPDNESDEGMLYYDYGTASSLTFLFDGDGYFQQSVVMMDYEYADKLAGYLKERYWYYGIVDDAGLYFNGLSEKEADVAVLFSVRPSSEYNDLMVQYIPDGSSALYVTSKAVDATTLNAAAEEQRVREIIENLMQK